MEVSEAADRYLSGDWKNPEVWQTLQAGSDSSGRDWFLLYHSLKEVGSLKDVPVILKRIINGEEWRAWKWINRDFKASSLGAYLTKRPPEGIGADLPMVEKLIENDPETLKRFRKLTTRPRGGDQKSEQARTNSDIITIDPKRGTSRAYTLERLERERPDLYEQVKAEKLSANAAAKLAGWRKQKSELELLRWHWRKASPREQETFRAEIL
jgi:hypothetical protein